MLKFIDWFREGGWTHPIFPFGLCVTICPAICIITAKDRWEVIGNLVCFFFLLLLGMMCHGFSMGENNE